MAVKVQLHLLLPESTRLTFESECSQSSVTLSDIANKIISKMFPKWISKCPFDKFYEDHTCTKAAQSLQPQPNCGYFLPISEKLYQELCSSQRDDHIQEVCSRSEDFTKQSPNKMEVEVTKEISQKEQKEVPLITKQEKPTQQQPVNPVNHVNHVNPVNHQPAQRPVMMNQTNNKVPQVNAGDTGNCCKLI